MSAAPVVPARLATLFSSRHRLVAWIEEHYSVVVEALDRFAEHQEWAVKGAVNTAEAEAPLLTAALARASLPAAPGARYLQERRIRAGIGMELRAWVARTCEEVTQELSALRRRHARAAARATRGEGDQHADHEPRVPGTAIAGRCVPRPRGPSRRPLRRARHHHQLLGTLATLQLLPAAG